MHHGNCKCGHHWVPKILMVLAWVAGVAFFWSGLKGVIVFGYEPLFYAWSTVVLAILAWSCNFCGCCGGYGHGGWGRMSAKGGSASGGEDGKMMNEKVCSHEGGCKCGDCDRCR